MLYSAARAPKTAGAVLAVLVACPVAAAHATPPRRRAATTPALVCTIEVALDGALSFRVRNPGTAPVVLAYFSPVVPTSPQATLAGVRLSFVEPGLDIGVRPMRLSIAPGTTETLASPIRLRFAPTAVSGGASDRFVWSIAHAPVRVALAMTLGSRLQVVRCVGAFGP